MQTWRTQLPSPGTADNENFSAPSNSDGNYCYRYTGWMMDCMDPVLPSVGKSNMRFNHYSTTPALDDIDNNSNADRLELPSNWISMASHYRDVRVEGVKVEQVLSIAPGSPPLFIAQFWSRQPIEPNRDYATLKQIPGIQFKFVNGVIPHTNDTDGANQTPAKVDITSNPNDINVAQTANRSEKEMVIPGKPTIVSIKSYRRAKTYFEGDPKQRKFLPLDTHAVYDSRTNFGSTTYIPTYSDTFVSDNLLDHQWYYHLQVAVSDPSIGWPALSIRAMLKITFYCVFKNLRIVRDNSLRTGKWLRDFTAHTMEIHTTLDEDSVVDQDNLTSAQSTWLAEHTKNRLPRRAILHDHGSDFRDAWNLHPEEPEYEGGHPYIMKEVGIFTNAGGDDNAQWADGEMADGTDLVADALDTGTQLTPVLVDIRHDSGGGFSNLPTGMLASELSAYLLDHD